MTETSAINVKELHNRLEGDFELLKDLFEIFKKDSVVLIERIEDAIYTGNSTLIAKHAHTIKGAVSNFSAQKAYNTACLMERKGKDNELNGINELLIQLKNDIDSTKKNIEVLIESGRWQ